MGGVGVLASVVAVGLHRVDGAPVGEHTAAEAFAVVLGQPAIGARTGPAPATVDETSYALLDVDDTTSEVHGHAKGAGFGYSGVRGLNALLATLVTATSAPVIVAQRLRKGSAGSPRGAKRLVGDAVKTTRRLIGTSKLVLVRMDSARDLDPSELHPNESSRGLRRARHVQAGPHDIDVESRPHAYPDAHLNGNSCGQ